MYQGWQISLWYCRPVNAAACAAANASKSSGDDDADMLETHLVDVLMGRRDQLDQRDRHARLDEDRLAEQQLGDRPAVPDVLDVRDAERLGPLPDDEVRVERLRPERKVAERVARDLDAERGEPALLLGEEARVVADDRVRRHGRRIARADVGAHRARCHAQW